MQKIIIAFLSISFITFFVFGTEKLNSKSNPGESKFSRFTDTQKLDILNSINSDCTWNGIALKGKVQFVDAFPDIKIQYVDAFPDIKVKWVTAFPDDCGEWQEVTAFPDFKVQVVTAFPDIKVQEVDAFPGL